jgi:transposase
LGVARPSLSKTRSKVGGPEFNPRYPHGGEGRVGYGRWGEAERRRRRSSRRKKKKKIGVHRNLEMVTKLP